MKTAHPMSLRLDSKTDKTLGELAASWSVSRSDVIRMAVRHACLCEDPSPHLWSWDKTAKKTLPTTVRFDLSALEQLDSLASDYDPPTNRTNAIILAVRHVALCTHLTWPLSDKPLPTKAIKRRYGVSNIKQ